MKTELISEESCLLMFRGKVNALYSELRILKQPLHLNEMEEKILMSLVDICARRKMNKYTHND